MPLLGLSVGLPAGSEAFADLRPPLPGFWFCFCFCLASHLFCLALRSTVGCVSSPSCFRACSEGAVGAVY